MAHYYSMRFETATYEGKPVRILGRSPMDVLIEIEDGIYATVKYTDLTFSENEVIRRNSVETR